MKNKNLIYDLNKRKRDVLGMKEFEAKLLEVTKI